MLLTPWPEGSPFDAQQFDPAVMWSHVIVVGCASNNHFVIELFRILNLGLSVWTVSRGSFRAGFAQIRRLADVGVARRKLGGCADRAGPDSC